MSVETSTTNEPGDEESHGRHSFFRSADSGADAPDVDDDEPQPRFTPAADSTGIDGTAVDGLAVGSPAVDSAVDPTAPTLNETDDVPVVADPMADSPAAWAPAAPAAAFNANEPLLADAVGLRASWQQAQAGFVDDPRAAVADAAELVEHTAQTLIGSLQQRQRQLRDQWDANGSGTAGTTATAVGELSDTEQLRHLMQNYRSLFNQLVQQ